MRVHLHVDAFECFAKVKGWAMSDAAWEGRMGSLRRTCDCPMYHRSVFELDSHGLVIQFHQKPGNTGGC